MFPNWDLSDTFYTRYFKECLYMYIYLSVALNQVRVSLMIAWNDFHVICTLEIVYCLSFFGSNDKLRENALCRHSLAGTLSFHYWASVDNQVWFWISAFVFHTTLIFSLSWERQKAICDQTSYYLLQCVKRRKSIWSRLPWLVTNAFANKPLSPGLFLPRV